MRLLGNKKIMVFMLLPTLAIYITYIFVPIIIAVYYSFTKFSGIGKPKFNGIENYVELVKDPVFWISLKNSMIIFVLSVVFLTALSFLAANLLNQKLKGNDVAKSLVFSPAILTPIIVGIIWVYIFEPDIGLLNNIFKLLHLDFLTIQWIGGPTYTPYSLAIVFIWQQLGFITTIFIAGLKMIPQELYEAADVDGANGFRKMVNITIPSLQETISIAVVLVITGSFKVFETVLMMTNGGPNHLSEVLVTYSYQTTFKGGEYGYGMTIAVAAFIVSLIFSIVYLLITAKKFQEGGA